MSQGTITPTATPILTECGYMPLVEVGPRVLTYPGSKMVSGWPGTTFTDTVWYNWGIYNGYTDTELARMVWGAGDYVITGSYRPATGTCSTTSRVPIWTKYGPGAYGTEEYSGAIAAAAADDYQHFRGRVWLIFNEPDNMFHADCTWDGYQAGSLTVTAEISGTTVETATVWAPRELALRYLAIRDLIRQYDPSAKTYPAGIIEFTGHGKWWWSEFVDQISVTVGSAWTTTIDGIAQHAYPFHDGSGCTLRTGDWPEAGEWCVDELHASLEDSWSYNYEAYGLDEKPVWLTEYGALPIDFCIPLSNTYGGRWSAPGYTDVLSNVMNPHQEWFASELNPGYDKTTWFMTWATDPNAWCTYLYTNSLPAMTQGVTLTLLGEDWDNWSLDD